MEITIITRTNQDTDFYMYLGRFIGNRQICKELGNYIYNDDDLTWFIALSGNAVIGFAALQIKDNTAWFRTGYVLSEHRNQGVYTALIESRIVFSHYAGCYCIKAIATNASCPILQSNGFGVIRSISKNFTEVYLDISI